MARTVIDALVVTLGLDASGFAAGSKAATAANTATGAAATQASQATARMGQAVGQALARVRTANTNTVASSGRMGQVVATVLGGVQKQSQVVVAGQNAAGMAMRRTALASSSAAAVMQSKGNVAGEFFSKIKSQALGLITVLLGSRSVLGFATQATKSLAAMGVEARNIGIPVGDLAAFRNAVEANGGSADAAGASFQKLTDNQQNWKTFGKADNLPGLNRIGAGATDSAADVMRKYADFRDKHPNDIQLVRQTGDMLGLDEGLKNLALKGRPNLERELTDAKARGVPTKPMTDRMFALQSAFIKAEQAAHALAFQLLDRFAPALTRILDALTAFIIANPQMATSLGLVATALGSVFTAALLFGRTIGRIVGAVTLLGTSFGSLITTLAGLISRYFPWLSIPAILLNPTPTGGADEDKRLHDDGNARRVARGGKTSEQEYQDSLSVRQQAYDFYKAKGLPEAHIAGILANIQGESNFDPNAADGTGAHGLFQMQGPRWRALMAQSGTDKPTVQQQLEHAWGEMSGPGTYNILKPLAGVTSPEESAKVVTRVFERPKNVDADSAKRAVMARDQLAQNLRGIQQERAATPLAANQNTTNSSTSTVAINGPINIHTQATDARGIAASLRDEMKSRGLVGQANRGLS